MADNLSSLLGQSFEPDRLQRSTAAIRQQLGKRNPRLALVLGSGWGGVRQLLEDSVCSALSEIPHFPCPQVSGHSAQLVLGRFAQLDMLVLAGRKHLYEGEGLAPVLYPIEVFRNLGIESIGLTNAAGAAHTGLAVGDLMVIRDHLDSTWHRYTAPLARLQDAIPGFLSLNPVFDPEWVEKLLQIGHNENLPVHAGVYAFTLGPFYESTVEVRCLAGWGADAIGMSTVPEAVFARLRGLRVFGLSGITNLGTGLATTPHSHDQVKKQAGMLAPRATKLLGRFLESLQ